MLAESEHELADSKFSRGERAIPNSYLDFVNVCAGNGSILSKRSAEDGGCGLSREGQSIIQQIEASARYLIPRQLLYPVLPMVIIHFN